MTYLLDVNVLIALVDRFHLHHAHARTWFDEEGAKAWATCPITENGVARIVGSRNYPNAPGAPAVVQVLTRFRAHAGHVFWPDDLSLVDSDLIDQTRLLNASQITDTYLLALAIAHGGRLATFDRRLISDAVVGGAKALHVIG